MQYTSNNFANLEQKQIYDLTLRRSSEEDELFGEQELYKGAQYQKLCISSRNPYFKDVQQLNSRYDDDVESVRNQTNIIREKSISDISNTSLNSQQANLKLKQINSQYYPNIKNQTSFKNQETQRLSQLLQISFTNQSDRNNQNFKNVDELTISQDAVDNLLNRASQDKHLNNKLIDDQQNPKQRNSLTQDKRSLKQKTFTSTKIIQNESIPSQINQKLNSKDRKPQQMRVAFLVFDFIKKIKMKVYSILLLISFYSLIQSYSFKVIDDYINIHQFNQKIQSDLIQLIYILYYT